MQRKRAPMTISVDSETGDRLRRYANQRHSTVSQIVTDWIWMEAVKNGPAETKAAENE